MVQAHPSSAAETNGHADPHPNEADKQIGARVRRRRAEAGLTQQQFAAMINVTYQQVHKYERGANRISASRLFDIARVLDTPIAWFFEGLLGGSPDGEPRGGKMSIELVRNFETIDNPNLREAISNMARTLAAQALNNKAEKLD